MKLKKRMLRVYLLGGMFIALTLLVACNMPVSITESDQGIVIAPIEDEGGDQVQEGGSAPPGEEGGKPEDGTEPTSGSTTGGDNTSGVTGTTGGDNTSGVTGTTGGQPQGSSAACASGSSGCQVWDAGTISCGQTSDGTVADNYEHHYRFSGTAGQVVTIAMDRVDGVDPYLHLIGPNGSEVTHNDDGAGYPDALIANQTLSQTGTYTIVARGYGLGGGDYSLSVTCGTTGSSQPPSTGASCASTTSGCQVYDAGSISCGQTITGTVADDYEHHFRFSGTAGQVVTIAMDQVDDVDPYLHLLAPNGSEVTHNDDGGGYPDALISNQTLSQTGTYTIVARGFGLSGGDYSINVTCGTTGSSQPPSTGGGCASGMSGCQVYDAGSISCGQTITGTIADDYEHHFQFSGTSGQTVTIAMNRVSDLDPYLHLLSPSGSEVTHDDDGAGYPNARIVQTLSQTGTYTIAARSFGLSGGDYSISVTCGTTGSSQPPSTGGGCVSTTPGCQVWDGGSMSCGESGDGTVVSGYEHHFSFNGTAGESVSILMTRVSDIDPYLHLIAPNGSQVASDDDGAGYPDALIETTLPQTGTYTIVARGFGLGDGDYNLSVTCGGGTTGGGTTGGGTTGGGQLTYGSAVRNIDLDAGFWPDPHDVSITSGGGIDASYLGGGCRGWAIQNPDLRLNWDGNGGRLSFYFIGSGDTTLIINDPHGQWHCNDDGAGYPNPGISFASAPDGPYDVWVASYSQGELVPGTLHISEFSIP